MKKTIANNVLHKIKRGTVKMRSPLSIFAQKIGIRGGILSLFLFLIFIAGLIFYWINLNIDLLTNFYGLYGPLSFLQSFPYLLILLFLVIVIFLVVILRTFDFSYKKPFIIIIVAIFCTTLLIGLFSSTRPLGKQLYENEGKMLGWKNKKGNNVINGVVTKISTNSLFVQVEGQIIFVKISGNTHYPFGKPVETDLVKVVGNWNNSVFEAKGIRILPLIK